MKFGKIGVALAMLFAVSVAGALLFQSRPEPLPTGRVIRPTGNQVNVGSFPINMVLSPDGKYIVVSDAGARERLSVLSSADGRLVSSVDFNGSPSSGGKGLYYGLSFGLNNVLFVAEGESDRIGKFAISADGQLTSLGSDIEEKADDPELPNAIAGLDMSSDGKTLYAVNNQTRYTPTPDGLRESPGSLAMFDADTGTSKGRVALAGYPFAVRVLPNGEKAYVTGERDRVVYVVSSSSATVPNQVHVGASPVNMTLSKDTRTLYVSNSGSDSISVVDTASDTVRRTILLRPTGAEKLQGCTPLGTTLSPNGKTLFVALADLNAVAVVNLERGSVDGYIPVGWYPTAVVLGPDGQHLFVANAKGVRSRVLNKTGLPVTGDATRRNPEYVENLLEGTISAIDLKDALSNLPELSANVLENANVTRNYGTLAGRFKNPHPKHVVYIIRENRTYDQDMGDEPKGNGDASLCMFPQNVTPNLHALAERFALLDNFDACGEVSPDGWNWSTSASANAYTQRNVRVAYSGRGRKYDFEGTNNGEAVDLYGIRDVAAPSSGYLWDAAFKKGLSFRNYGCFIANSGPNDAESNAARKALVNVTDKDFRQFDMGYPDSDAWTQLSLELPARERKTFGSFGSASRFSEWKREFDDSVKNLNMPALSMIRLPRDHTQGTARGFSSPRAMVADNDYALGEIVETISRSPYWRDTVICVLEDDSQSGHDHVDCHRVPALVISPFVKPGLVQSRFYNTNSMLRTIEIMLGLDPMNQYDAFAEPIDVFDGQPKNGSVYAAIMPEKDVLGSANGPASYRAADSARILSPLREEASSDLELNDILWGATMGARKPASAQARSMDTD